MGLGARSEESVEEESRKLPELRADTRRSGGLGGAGGRVGALGESGSAGWDGASAGLCGAWHGPRESISPAPCPLPHTPACYLTAAEIRGSPGGPRWPGVPRRAPPWSNGPAAGVSSSVAKPPESVESETGHSPFSVLAALHAGVRGVPFHGRLCCERGHLSPGHRCPWPSSAPSLAWEFAGPAAPRLEQKSLRGPPGTPVGALRHP